MWAMEPGWDDALSGDHTPMGRVSVLYDGTVTFASEDPEEMSEIIDGSITSSLTGGDNPQIVTSVDLRLSDPEGGLFTGRPDSAIGWWGHRLQLQAGARAGDWEQWLPVGTLRIDEVTPVETAPWRLHRNGRWTRGAQTLSIKTSDLLSQVGDERFTQPTSPPSSATVRSEIGRLCSGIVPVGLWSASQRVPSTLTYDTHDRLGAVASLCRVAGLVPYVDRVGVLQAVPATGSGQRWTVPMDALIECLPSGSRDGISNGWIVTSESESQQPLRGQSFEGIGPLRWGGPFGRIPSFAHSPILTTNASCAAAARTNQSTDIASRRQTITITCLANPAVDVLDTAVIELPDRTIEALITGIRSTIGGGTMQVTASAPLEILQ